MWWLSPHQQHGSSSAFSSQSACARLSVSHANTPGNTQHQDSARSKSERVNTSVRDHYFAFFLCLRWNNGKRKKGGTKPVQFNNAALRETVSGTREMTLSLPFSSVFIELQRMFFCACSGGKEMRSCDFGRTLQI